MLLSTWNTYRNTFERQRSGYLQALIQDSSTSRGKELADAAGDKQPDMSPGTMKSADSSDSASSSITLQPLQNQYASLDGSRVDLSESIGTVFSGVQLSALGEDHAEEVAKIVAERGVVFFEGQYDFSPSEQDRFIAYFDPSHATAATSKHEPTQKSGPEVTPFPVQHEWQSDSTHQAEPPSLSIQIIGEAETITAESAWVSQYGVYDSLSSPVQRLVAEVTAIHGLGQQTAEHPAVKTHPITRLKALNIVLGNVTGIPQLKKKESDKFLELLDYELQSAAEHTIRWKWKAGDVALWDNRCTAYRHISGASLLKQNSTHVSFVREKTYYDPSSESRSERQSRIKRQEKEERERIEAIKRRYNNTPLRRIIARQSSRETTLIQITPIQSVGNSELLSPVDSVISKQDAAESTKPWTIFSDNGLKQKPVPVKKSNTPLRRILERQVASSVVVNA